jgi:hypothetical protein
MLADVLSPIYFSPPGLLVGSVLSLAGIVLIEGLFFASSAGAHGKSRFCTHSSLI